MDDAKPLVIIFGESSGVGRATAHRFAAAGYRIGLLARIEEGLIETQEELRQYGVPVMSISLDVADSQAVESAAIRLDNTPGPLSIWINSAMVTVFSPIDKLSTEDIQRVTEVTYLGPMHGTLAALQIDASAWWRALPMPSPLASANELGYT